MQPPLVSVLMTCYNREAYIRAAVESVLASTFRDFELIIVDDGSTDSSVERARSYVSDSRVRVHVNERNLGDYPNRRRAAELARGKYLKYVDSDDCIYSHGLQAMVAAMEQFPAAGLGLERPPAGDRPYPVEVSPVEAYREHFLGAGLFGCGPSGTIMPKAAYDAAGGFGDKRSAGDYDMWLRLGARFPVVKLPSGLVWWRIHPGQETHDRGSELRQLEATLSLGMRALGPSCPLPAEEKAAALKRLRHAHARRLLRMALIKRQPLTAWRLMRASGLSPGEILRGFKSYG